MTADTTISSRVSVSGKTITVDLAGHKIIGTGTTFYTVADSSNSTKLTLTDSVGTGEITSNGANINGFIGVNGDGNAEHAPTLEFKNVIVRDGANANVVYNTGTLTYAYSNIIVDNSTIEGAQGTKDLNAEPGEAGVGIYCAGVANVTVKNGSVIKGETGLEIRAGSLTVEGSSIIGTGGLNGTYAIGANGNGSTNAGAGIAVSQHTTLQDISVTVSGNSEVSGPIALVVANPQANTTNSSIEVNITGGTFTSTRDVALIAAQNTDSRATVNISNATFNGVLSSENVVSTAFSNGAFKLNGAININGIDYSPTGEEIPFTYKEPGNDTNLYGVLGWNADSKTKNKYNYVIQEAIGESGKIILGVEGVSDAKNLAVDKTNKIIGVPASATATWQNSYTDGSEYKLAKLGYNGNKTAVTVSTESANALINADSLLASTVEKIDASSNTVAIIINGNANTTAITGGAGNDSLVAGSNGVTLDGGAGDNTLKGGAGADTFIYNGGNNRIQGYSTDDSISLASDIDPVTVGSSISSDENGFTIGFGTGNSLTFDGNDVEAKIKSGSQIYTYKKDSILFNKNVILAAGASVGSLGNDNDYNLVDASAVEGRVSLIGNAFANTLTAGNGGNSLDGGLGNDNLRGGDGADLFVYGDKSGKDVIYNYGAGDRFSVTAANIASGTANTNTGDLVFKIDNSNSITFKPTGENENQDVTTILLADGTSSLTKDGTISADSKMLTLFKEQKGKINLADSIYSGVAGIDASQITDNVVTMTGGTGGGTFTFANNKKKADVFEYGGGAVSLSGYTAGVDKIDLVEASWQSFSVDSTGVSLTTDKGVITIGGAQGQEVLLHDATGKNNSFSKMIFAANGVLHDKDKNPTSATLSAGVESLYSADSSINKITIGKDVTAISVQAGSKNTVIDASNASATITLMGGSGNDKFTGREGADTFVFTKGKDVITNYESGDNILAEGFDLGSAKITQSKKSVTLKFDNKNSLAIKSGEAIGTININGTAYNFGKNAVITGTASSQTASLTSNFSGTYKAGSDVTTIDGSAIAKKNYTMQGTSTAETLTAGGSDSNNGANKKVTFKGGGGGDSLVGGTSKDSFFYGKNDTGATTVDYFDYANDNVKIKRTLTDINKTNSGLEFEMGTGNTLTIKTVKSDNNNANVDIDTSKVLIKANNTLYWFEDSELYTAKDKESKDQIKSVLRSRSDYAIVDLNYSTNLIKGKVAKESETGFTAAMVTSYKIK